MGEHQKLAAAKSKRKRPASKKKPAAQKKMKKADENPNLKDIDERLACELARITALQESLEETLSEGGATPALLRESNGLTRALGQLSAEMRMRDNHKHAAVENISEADENEVVLHFLSSISPVRLAIFRAALRGADESDQLLGHT